MPQFPSSRARLLALATLLVATSAVVVACSDSTGPGRTLVRVELTDAPFPYDSVNSVDVFVVRIDARQRTADSADAAQNVSADSSRTRGGWTVLAEPQAAINIAALRTDTASLGTVSLESGSWSALRMIIDPARSSITLKNGTKLTVGTSGSAIVFPSAAQSGIKINLTGNRSLQAGDTTRLVIDFDLDNSFVMRGNSLAQNGLLMKPTIKAVFREE